MSIFYKFSLSSGTDLLFTESHTNNTTIFTFAPFAPDVFEPITQFI